MAPVGARLTPLVQLVAHAVSGGAVEYEAVGDDPQFRVDPDYGIHALAPGWYVMDIVLRVSEGDIQRPCLYPDYGGGCSEATRISLPQPDAAGRIHALVLISTPLRALRFDPSIRPTRFELGAMTFRRVTRARCGSCCRGRNTPEPPRSLRRRDSWRAWGPSQEAFDGKGSGLRSTNWYIAITALPAMLLAAICCGSTTLIP